ncbi:MAG: hypothetical protein CMLOHMNK_03066 [Steroidobacteraceae bacterium]|nr:hypothetical protein [Steroidobacteraceae bacterium]
MRQVTVFGALAVLLVTSADADAVPIQASTGTYVTQRDCLGPGGVCSPLSEVVYGEYGGTPGGVVSAAGISSTIYGTTASSTVLPGVAGAPTLAGFAASEEDRRISTNSFVLQRYTYTGSASATRNLGGSLSYSQTITDPLNADYSSSGESSGVYAHLRIFMTPGSFAEAGDTAESNYELLYAFANADGSADFSLVAESEYKDLLSNSSGSGSLSTQVTLAPGDAFWVWAFLQTPAADGSVVDVSSGLILNWDNSENLVPAAHAVPEPGTLALLATGLALIGLTRPGRMRRSAFKQVT